MPRRDLVYRQLQYLEDQDYHAMEQLSALSEMGTNPMIIDGTAEIPGTGPEKMVYNYLLRLGIRFQYQYHQEDIQGTLFPEEIYIPDFFLPDYNTYLEVFGLYWHAMTHSRESDLEKWARQLYGGKLIIEHGLATFPTGGGYNGKYIIWWDYEIYQDLAGLIARDVPELFNTELRTGGPDPYLLDREEELKASKARVAGLVASRIKPKISPFSRSTNKLRRKQFDLTKTYPFLSTKAQQKDIYFGIPREVLEKRGRKKNDRGK